MLIFDTDKHLLMKIILIVLLVFYGLILLTRYLGPILFRYFLKKLGAKYGASSAFNTKEEDLSVSKKKVPKPPKEKVGEYIDFEEID